MSLPMRFGDRVATTRDNDRVSLFEVFFDLVFVFALSRAVELMASDPEPASLVRGLLVLFLLWWAWCAFIWLGNQVRLDRGFVLAVLLTVMGALFVVALFLPSAWLRPPGGVGSGLLLAAAFIVVRVGYFSLFVQISREHPRLRRQVLIDAVPQTVSAVLLVVGALPGGTVQTVLWGCAFVADFGGGWVGSHYNGWRLGNPGHFVERHGLVLIIALGETLLSTGAGLGLTGLNPLALADAALAFVIAVSLWWAFFGSLAEEAGSALRHASSKRRPAIARDGYTLGNFPLVAAIVYLSLGLTLLLDEVAMDPSRPLGVFAGSALAGGLALYLVTLEMFRWVTVRRFRARSLIAVTATVGAVEVTSALPASATLAVVAAVAAAGALWIGSSNRPASAATPTRGADPGIDR